MKVIACIIARTVSQRLPLKILRDLRPGVTMIEFLIRRVKAEQSVSEVYICTSREPVDDILEDIAIRNGVKIYRGSADEVIERMLAVGRIENADILLRITGDNPFTATEFFSTQLELLRREQLDYVRVIDVPIGATAEMITFDALKRCNEMMDPSVSEYLMLYIFEPRNFRCGVIKPFKQDFSDYSVTVDTPDDLKRTKQVIASAESKGVSLTLSNIIDLYEQDESIVAKRLKSGGDVKLPYGKVIAFSEFKEDMKRRVQGSKKLTTHE